MLESFGDPHRVDARVGEAYEMLVLPGLGAAEMHARAHRDTSRVEHRAPKVLDISEALHPHRVGDVRKEVKGAIGFVTADAGRLVQERDRHVTSLAQDRQDVTGPGLVARKPLEGAVLDEGGR